MKLYRSTLSAISLAIFLLAATGASAEWLQWSHDPRHNGFVSDVQGQPLEAVRACMVNDAAVPPAPQSLLIHYDVPKIDDSGNIYISYREREGSIIRYSVKRLDESIGGALPDCQAGAAQWTFRSDYRSPSSSWEPAFAFLVANNQVYAAGAYGVIHVLDPNNGMPLFDIASYDVPSDETIRSQLLTTVAVSGQLTSDADGTIYYSVRALTTNPIGLRSHVVKAGTDGTVISAAYSDLTGDSLIQPPYNSGPAIAPDGTIYVAAARNPQSFSPSNNQLIALNPDLTVKWIGSMEADASHRGLLIDQSTSCPVVGPDGRVFLGGWNSNQTSDGYLYAFSGAGQFLGWFPFGWDTTPGIYPDPDGDPTHYHLIEKLNLYSSRRYYLVSINPDGMSTNPSTDPTLHGQEWAWELPTPGRELCVNAVVIDRDGTSYVNGEDGFFYRVTWGGADWSRIFLSAPRDAAYTPASMGADGTLYTLNDGKFFVVGSAR